MPGTPGKLVTTLAVTLIGIVSVSAGTPEILVGVADAYIAQDESGRAWTVANQGIELRLGLNATGALVMLGLGPPGAEVTWPLEPSPGLSFLQQNRRLSPGQSGFPFQAAYADEYGGGVRLRLVFNDEASGLGVTRTYVCYPEAPAVEVWTTFEAANSASGIPISDVGVWQLTVPIQRAHYITGLSAGTDHGGHLTRRMQEVTEDQPFEVGSAYRSSELTIPTMWFSGPYGNLFGGVLWSGTWSLAATSQTRRGMATLRLSAGSTATTVRTGDPFESPHGFFGIAGDRDVDVTEALQQYVRNGLRRGRGISPLVTYNTWFAHGTEIDDETVRADMRSAASLGVELFVIDAGWAPGARSKSDYSTGLGTWAVDSVKFPAGLGSLGDYARSLGMKFGVWVEPERVDTSTLNRAGLARERFLATTGGRYNAGVKNENADAAQICLGDSEARQWVLSQLFRFIDKVRPDYLKWDNNYWINCTRTSHGHGTQDGNFAHVDGLYTVLAALRARYPDLVIENCSGGGNRLDFGMLRYSDVAWMDDVSGPSVHVRHNLQGLGAVFPPRYLLSFVMDDPAEPIHRAADMSLYFRSRMAGALGLSIVGSEFGEDDLSDMSREIALYKRLRDVSAEPTFAMLTGQASETDSSVWDAMQLSARDTGSGFVLAFRGSSADSHMRIRPLNLWPGTSYQLATSRGRALAQADGATLMQDGVEIGEWPYSAGHVVTFTPVGR
jgi:alpha-galactosidase